MNWKEIESRKHSRWQLQYDRREIAVTVKEINPECKGVYIKGRLSFISGVGSIEPVIIDISLSPEDKAYYYHNCPNKDCTGFGFSLTDKIREAVCSMKEIKDVLFCDGKEDWKYINASGCSCTSRLEYQIIPKG